MALFSDLAGIPNPYDGQPRPGPTEPNYEQADQIGQSAVDSAHPPGPPDAKITSMTTKLDKDGKPIHSVTMTDSFFQEIQRLSTIGTQAETAFSQARQDLERKRDFLRANPGLAAIGRIASAAASEYSGGPQGARISPLVHASGAYGNDLFGQSTDNLNAQIAGLSQQAMQAQIPYANLLEKGANIEAIQAEKADAAAKSAYEKSRVATETERKNRENEINRVSKITEDGAKAGFFNRAQFLSRQSRLGVPDDEARAAADTYEQIAKNVKDDKAAARSQAEQDKFALENLKYRNRAALAQQRFANSVSPTAMDFKVKEARLKGDLRNSLVGDKELTTVGSKDKDKLVAASQTDLYLDKVKGFLSRPELAGLTGPAFAVYKDKAGNYQVSVNQQSLLPRFARSADRVEIEALMQHEIPRIMTTVLNLQGGASILRSEEGRKMVAKLGASLTDRPDQIMQILETVRDTNNDTKSAIMKAHPKVDWSNYSDLLGLTNPNNAKYFVGRRDSIGGPINGAPAKAVADPLGIR